MCGIVGYIGPRETAKVLIDGLKRLEYRGYDSAGIAVFHRGKVEIRRKEGKLSNLEELIGKETFDGKVGIGHTRWATHGRPSDENAHPHKAGKVAVVHNGIIENYLSLKEILKSKGRVFSSETDTEIISHLIDEFVREGYSSLEAVRRALDKIKGSYALGILLEGEEQSLIAARKESPLVIGSLWDRTWNSWRLLKWTRTPRWVRAPPLRKMFRGGRWRSAGRSRRTSGGEAR